MKERVDLFVLSHPHHSHKVRHLRLERKSNVEGVRVRISTIVEEMGSRRCTVKYVPKIDSTENGLVLVLCGSRCVGHPYRRGEIRGWNGGRITIRGDGFFQGLFDQVGKCEKIVKTVRPVRRDVGCSIFVCDRKIDSSNVVHRIHADGWGVQSSHSVSGEC